MTVPTGRRRAGTPPWQRMAALFVTGLAWCVAASAGGAAAQGAEPPSLVILPTSSVQVKPEGRNALLTCRATGVGAGLVTGLRWRGPEGREVPQPLAAQVSKPPVYAERFSSDGSLSLIFQSLTRNDEGNYTCEGQYARGQELARSVQIRVIKAISWVDAPPEQFPRRGESFKIKCQVEAEPPPTVDWQKDGAQLTERYRVETDGIYIADADTQDDGIYTCRAIVVATGELQTRPIKVEVQVPPQFLEEKREATVKAKHDETLQCSAQGRPPPEYKWIFEGTGRDLNAEGGRFQVNAITGDLHISPVHPDDDGLYSCVASNRAGDSSQKVRLHVQVPPRVALVRNATAAEGTASQVECEARGRPLPSVSWRRHGEDNLLSAGQQGADPRVSTSSRPAGPEHPDRSDGVLVWDEVRREDDGLYACVAQNEAGYAESFAHLTVEFKPSFSNTPYSETWSWDTQVANITCLAESIPNATIHWYYNERDIEKTREPSFKKHGQGPQSWLEIDSSYQKRYGSYRCVAKNKLGEAQHDIILHRADIPGPIMQAVFEVVTATSIKFKIMGPSDNGGIPMRLYHVRYREIDDGSNWKNKTWTAEADYTLENLRPLTRYEFQFAAQNDVGLGPWSSSSTKVMPKRSPPEPPPLLDRPLLSAHPDKPIDTAVTSAYSAYFELRWQIPADNGEPILNYVISWCPARETNEGHWEQDKQSGSCQERKVIANLHTTSYRLQPLQPDTYYMVHLHATNNIGASIPSLLLLRTPPGAERPSGAEGVPPPGASLSSAALVAAVVSALLTVLLLLDLCCFACRRAGVIAALCERARGKEAPDDPTATAGLRIGASHTKDPLRDEMRPLAPGYPPSVKRDTSVGFDGKTTAVTRSTFVGKDSAV